MPENFGRRKHDGDFVVYASEEIGKLKEAYTYASDGFKSIMAEVQKLDRNVDDLRAALYGDGPDKIGVFERIRTLALKIATITVILCTLGGFAGQWLAKVIFK